MHLTSRGRTVEVENAVLPMMMNDPTISSDNNSIGSNTLILEQQQQQQQKSSLSSNDKHASKLILRRRRDFASYLLVRLKYHWALLSNNSKMSTAIVLLFLFQHVLLGVWDQCFHQIGRIESTVQKGESKSSSSSENYFAVAINTYKRPDMLRDAVNHYADTCGRRAGVGQVFVIWAEQGVSLPEPSSFFTPTANSLRNTNTAVAPPNRAEVHVLQKAKDSLNSRFEPIEELKYTAVFMVDDDVRVSCPSLMHGFNAWKTQPDSMVGYYPRLASPPRNRNKDATRSSSLSSLGLPPTKATTLIYHTWPVVYLQHKFNFVLTKASFLHSKYLILYTGTEFPQSIKDHVDEHMNCEDIAMSMLVANYTKFKFGTPSSPIYVEGTVKDKGLIGGISTGSGHFTSRSDCLSTLDSIFQSKGWGSPLAYQVDLGSHAWIQHAPGFWWQYRPSNVFEWLGLANTFT